MKETLVRTIPENSLQSLEIQQKADLNVIVN